MADVQKLAKKTGATCTIGGTYTPEGSSSSLKPAWMVEVKHSATAIETTGVGASNGGTTFQCGAGCFGNGCSALGLTPFKGQSIAQSTEMKACAELVETGCM